MSEEIIHRHKGKIDKNGKVFIDDINWYNNNKDVLRGKEIFITMQEYVEPVSKNFHNYYRGPVTRTALQSETFGGWTANEFHEYYVEKLLVTYSTKQKGDQVITLKKIPSTANISTKKMKWFVEKVKDDLATHGIEIKDYENYEVTK